MYQCHVVIDLEFTPIPRRFAREREIVRHEIIQIGAIMLDEGYRKVRSFTCFVKPSLAEGVEPNVSRLTGIQDKDLESAPDLKEALARLTAWIGGDKRTRIYSWSLTDLYQLEDECDLKDIEFPLCMYRWMDFQTVYGRLIGCHHRLKLKDAISSVDGDFFTAQAHTALYDAEVTAELLILVKNPEEFAKRTRRIRRLFRAERCTSTIGEKFGDQLAALFGSNA